MPDFQDHLEQFLEVYAKTILKNLATFDPALCLKLIHCNGCLAPTPPTTKRVKESNVTAQMVRDYLIQHPDKFATPKVAAVKAYRQVSGSMLKEAKDWVEANMSEFSK